MQKYPLISAFMLIVILALGVVAPLCHFSKFLFGSAGSFVSVIVLVAMTVLTALIIHDALEQDRRNDFIREEYGKK